MVFLRYSKTDQFGSGGLGRTGQTLCPIAAVLSYLAVHPNHPGPLFVSPAGIPLSRGHLVAAVREALHSHGIDTSLYSGHSFRIGAATTAAQAGIGDAVIKQLGMWKSSAYSTYIRLPCRDLLHTGSRLINHSHTLPQ